MLDDATLDKWEALDRARTQGRWVHTYQASECVFEAVHPYATIAECRSTADAMFASAASEAVPALIAEVRRLRAKLSVSHPIRPTPASDPDGDMRGLMGAWADDATADTLPPEAP
jgi:hypothetical protein